MQPARSRGHALVVLTPTAPSAGSTVRPTRVAMAAVNMALLALALVVASVVVVPGATARGDAVDLVAGIATGAAGTDASGVTGSMREGTSLQAG